MPPTLCLKSSVAAHVMDDLPGCVVPGEWGQLVYAVTPRGYGTSRYGNEVSNSFRGHIDRSGSASTLSGRVNGMHYGYITSLHPYIYTQPHS